MFSKIKVTFLLFKNKKKLKKIIFTAFWFCFTRIKEFSNITASNFLNKLIKLLYF